MSTSPEEEKVEQPVSGMGQAQAKRKREQEPESESESTPSYTRQPRKKKKANSMWDVKVPLAVPAAVSNAKLSVTLVATIEGFEKEAAYLYSVVIMAASLKDADISIFTNVRIDKIKEAYDTLAKKCGKLPCEWETFKGLCKELNKSDLKAHLKAVHDCPTYEHCLLHLVNHGKVEGIDTSYFKLGADEKLTLDDVKAAGWKADDRHFVIADHCFGKAMWGEWSGHAIYHRGLTISLKHQVVEETDGEEELHSIPVGLLTLTVLRALQAGKCNEQIGVPDIQIDAIPIGKSEAARVSVERMVTLIYCFLTDAKKDETLTMPLINFHPVDGYDTGYYRRAVETVQAALEVPQEHAMRFPLSEEYQQRVRKVDLWSQRETIKGLAFYIEGAIPEWLASYYNHLDLKFFSEGEFKTGVIGGAGKALSDEETRAGFAALWNITKKYIKEGEADTEISAEERGWLKQVYRADIHLGAPFDSFPRLIVKELREISPALREKVFTACDVMLSANPQTKQLVTG